MPYAILFAFLAIGLLSLTRTSAGADGQKAAEGQKDDLQACISDEQPSVSYDACTRMLAQSARQRALLLTMRAVAQIKKGELAGAATDLTAAIEADPTFEPVWETRGDMLRNNNQCDLALADYDQAIRLSPDRAPLHFNRALCRLDQDQIDGGIIDLDNAVQLDAENKDGLAVAALGVKAVVDNDRKNFEGALKSFDSAIALDPGNPLLYLDRGKVWNAKGDAEKAKADYGEVIRLDANNASGYAASARTLKARIEASGGNLDAALAEYDEAIKLDSKKTNLYLDRAKLWNQKGNDERALADYNQAIETAPSAGAYQARADFRRGKGDYDLAIADYDKAIEQQADDVIAYGNRALSRFYKGDFATAAVDFKRVVDSQLNAYPVLLSYISKSRDGDARDAKSEFTKNAAKLKTGAWPYPVVELYLGKKSVKDTEAQAKSPGEKCEAQFYIGEWHLLKKEKDQATKALQAAVDNCPKDFVEYRAAVEELKRVK